MSKVKRPFASSVAHTPLFESLRRAFRIAAISRRPGAPSADELVEMYREGHLSRRLFLQGTVAAGALIGVGGLLSSCREQTDGGKDGNGKNDSGTAARPTSQDVRIAIVGGGVAGLNAAYKLKNAGHSATVFEAASRTGGRIYTARDIMAPGLTTELGGEFIDSNHQEMLALASEFGLTLLDTRRPSEQGLASEVFYFGGKRYSEKQVIAAFRSIADAVQSDYDSSPDVVDYRQGHEMASIDRMSIAQYFDKIGAAGWFRELLDVAYETEYGLTIDQQSALNFLFLLGTDMDYSDGSFKVFGESDERYKIDGGNQRIVDELASRVDEQIKPGHRLEAIRSRGNGFTLSFRRGPDSVVDVNADVAIITIPFTMLRQVDLSGVTGLPEVKKKAIAELGYGTNAKVMAGFTRRVWRDSPGGGVPGASGYFFTDEGCQTGWDNSQLQSGEAGGITFFLGGPTGAGSNSGTAASQVDGFMPGLEKIFPGATGARNGRAERFHWPTHEFTMGSYACYKPGQWTTIAGAESLPVGNLFFAGEHCSYDFQGFMNGGAETGKTVAEAVAALLGAKVVKSS